MKHAPAKGTSQRLPTDLGRSNNLVLRPGCLMEGSGLPLKAPGASEIGQFGPDVTDETPRSGL